MIVHGRHAMLVQKAHVSLPASSDIDAGSEVAEQGPVGYARVRRLRHAAPDKAKFIQKWGGHANTYYGGGSGLDYHVGIRADAAYATIRLCDHSDYALCLCDEFY